MGWLAQISGMGLTVLAMTDIDYRALERLELAGIKIVSDREAGADRYVAMGYQWAPDVHALARYRGYQWREIALAEI